MLQKQTAVNIRCLTVKEKDADSEDEMDLSDQLVFGLHALLQNEFELGHRDEKQKEQLSGNVEKLKNELCFVQRHWKVLSHADFPHLPQDFDDKVVTSKIILATAGMNRTGNSKK